MHKWGIYTQCVPRVPDDWRSEILVAGENEGPPWDPGGPTPVQVVAVTLTINSVIGERELLVSALAPCL